MTTHHELSFSSRALSEDGLYKLLELPPDLCSLIESQLQGPSPSGSNLSLCVKGGPTDDAVLCTPNETYAVRSVALSNSVLVVTAPPEGSEHDSEYDASASESVPGPGVGAGVDEENRIVIRDQVNEILELTRTMPKLHKLDALLRGSVYNGEDDEDEDDDALDNENGGMSYEVAMDSIQGSQGEIDAALKARKILDLRGRLRPIAPLHLHTILELILTQLASLSLGQNTHSLPFKQLSTALDEEHQIPRTVSWQVMEWFGEMVPGTGGGETRWKMDVPGVVRQVGLGVLRPYKDNPIEQEAFLKLWREAVGDTFEETVSMTLLSSNYLSTSTTEYTGRRGAPGETKISLTYFPSDALSTDPATRFQELFLTRKKWRSADITPFLDEIAVNSKERDKLLLKFARSTTDAEGTWFTARAMYMG